MLAMLHLLLAAPLLLALAFARPAAALVIDTFDSGDPFALENVGSGAPSISQPANVLGGTRTVSTTARVAFDPALGLEFTVIGGVEVNLAYQASGMDFTADGADRFRMLVDPLQLPIYSYFDVIVLINGSQLQLVGGPLLPLPVSGAPPTEYPLEFPFFPFADSADLRNAVDLTVQFRLNSDVGQRVRILDFRTVPEPSTAPLFLMGVAVVFAWARSKRARV